MQDRKELTCPHLCCSLPSTRKGVEEADPGRGHQEQDEDDIVHSGEVHLDHGRHGDPAVLGGEASSTPMSYGTLVHRLRSRTDSKWRRLEAVLVMASPSAWRSSPPTDTYRGRVFPNQEVEED